MAGIAFRSAPLEHHPITQHSAGFAIIMRRECVCHLVRPDSLTHHADLKAKTGIPSLALGIGSVPRQAVYTIIDQNAFFL